MKTNTSGTRVSHWQVYWIGLGVAAGGGGWLALSAFSGYAQWSQGSDRAALSPWLVAQVVCAIGLILGGFLTMAGSSTWATGLAIDFERRRDIEDDRSPYQEDDPQASRWASAPGGVDEFQLADEFCQTSHDDAEPFGPPKPFIMIRCRHCEMLNSEHRETCTACEHAI